MLRYWYEKTKIQCWAPQQTFQVLLAYQLCEAYEVGWDFVIAPEQQCQ